MDLGAYGGGLQGGLAGYGGLQGLPAGMSNPQYMQYVQQQYMKQVRCTAALAAASNLCFFLHAMNA